MDSKAPKPEASLSPRAAVVWGPAVHTVLGLSSPVHCRILWKRNGKRHHVWAAQADAAAVRSVLPKNRSKKLEQIICIRSSTAALARP